MAGGGSALKLVSGGVNATAQLANRISGALAPKKAFED